MRWPEPEQENASSLISAEMPAARLSYGMATANAADVYLHVAEDFGAEGWTAELHGPYSTRSRTLPARFVFRSQTPGRWHTTVVDPCFWSPDYPGYYRFTWRDAEGTPRIRRELGIRHFGVRGNSLWLENRRWVYRAAPRKRLEIGPPHDWSKAFLAWIVDTYDPLEFWQASRQGVMLALRATTHDVYAECLRASAFPAIAMAIIPVDASIDREQWRRELPNLLCVAEATGDDLPIVPSWCDAMMVDRPNPQRPDLHEWLQAVRTTAVPWIAKGVIDTAPFHSPRISPGVARTACEQLQRELVGTIEWSGYVVE